MGPRHQDLLTDWLTERQSQYDFDFEFQFIHSAFIRESAFGIRKLGVSDSLIRTKSVTVEEKTVVVQ
jgi:hypothetical protein